jgi:two-component system, LytTR family, response regulator
MTKAIVVEDELNARELLIKYLTKYCELEVIGEAGDVEEAETLIAKLKPDIVFLDISLPIHNGFELIERLQPIDFEVIFITAYDQYAIQAIKISAIDYLLKPISISELKLAVTKAKAKIAGKNQNKNLNILLENLNQNNQSKKIAIPDGSSYIYEEISNIVRLQADGRYSNIYTLSGKKYLVTKNLGEFDKLLTPYSFLRVHHSHLINPNHIHSYEKIDGGHLIMVDKSHVDVSRKNKEDLIRFLKKSYA